jgi:two-component system NtrC family sensor kinase
MEERILVVDDNPAIHADFAKILIREPPPESLDDLERLALGSPPQESPSPTYLLDFAFHGAEALEHVQARAGLQQPYALAFVDMWMPPGWDGLETIERLWEADPNLQMVICTAYSDYDWQAALERLQRPEKLLLIKKPFEPVVVRQCANALAARSRAERKLREQLREQSRLRQAAEDELGLAQKLESVGRLAAGIAHEINTPVQYISDSMHFLKSAFGELATALGPVPKEPDLAFVCEEVPLAIERVLEGTERLVGIVRAMKEFAHPDGGEKAPADLNRALQTTLLIARNEYKYVAVAELQAGAIPEVTCNVGELSQVFLNLIVNSAHALADAGRDSETGRITIRTSPEGEWVVITFTDNGCGIPPSIMHKIFDPFFTTKEAGRGSGQGLAIARSIIVDKHGGRLDVGSEPGRGTYFTVRLPVEAVPAAAP